MESSLNETQANSRSHAHDDHSSCGHGHHGHAHTLGHVHAPSNFGWAFAIGILLNGGFVISEAFYGFRGNSLALLSDAGHNLGDVLGLLAAWAASILAAKAPTAKHTYGFRRSPILAALLNAMILLLSTGAIICESIRRLISPSSVAGDVVMVVAAVGIAINLSTALMFAFGSKDDINVRGAFTHMLGDAVVAFGVVVAGFAIRYTHISAIDPVVSILVAGIVLLASWKLLKEALNMAMDGVPQSVNFKEVRQFLLELPGVVDVHDLHIWSMGTSECALTVHLIRPGGTDDAFMSEIGKLLAEKFGVDHPTIQIEDGTSQTPCAALCEIV
jgi:cobalt-zinc-cadmium efflux system protein